MIINVDENSSIVFKNVFKGKSIGDMLGVQNSRTTVKVLDDRDVCTIYVPDSNNKQETIKATSVVPTGLREQYFNLRSKVYLKVNLLDI
ncbi:hypothetical protein SAGO17_0016 [Mimivirus AB-566-O17]|uniref:Uncharacterized protein n=1 Tax=Mimivirus AB-566-O17 TaxID=1988039 RepID=A0A1X9VNP2_9VIRU|nr:hypothetical protein SAGO17_0016 [Mimivirus AB-566-O17]